MENVKVSICLAYYNRSDYVKDCIGSLLSQEYDSFEVVVVNDGSSDPQTLKNLRDIDDPRLTVIDQENTGFVGAIRRAIEEARGQYIAIMGAGDVCAPSRIAKQAMFLDNNPEYGIVSCMFENVVFGGKDDGNRRKRAYPRTEVCADDFLSGLNPIGHGEVMFRRDLYDKVGGYRHFFRFSQDLDLWLRMVDHCKIKVLDEFLYERRMFTADGISTNLNKQFLQKYLAEFARQSYIDRQRWGRDFVDIHGMHAGLFKRKNKALSRYSAIVAFNALKDNRVDDARYYLEIAQNEGRYKTYWAVKCLFECRTVPILGIFARKIISSYKLY